jgi:trans-aconitate methyltransferase
MKQTWNPETYNRNARFVSDLGMPVVELLDPKPGERILDLDCGDGVLTRKLEDIGCEVIGIDSSPELVQAAATLGLNVMTADATEMDFSGEFDAVFSNAVLHWIKDADRVIRNVFEALLPGGRFVAECGGHRCIATIQEALIAELEKRGHDGWAVNPWYFPTAQEYGGRLSRVGFDVRYIEVIARPTRLPGDITDFLETFASSFIAALAPENRNGYIDDVRARLKPLLCAEDGSWTADYIRLRFEAHKKSVRETEAPLGNPALRSCGDQTNCGYSFKRTDAQPSVWIATELEEEWVAAVRGKRLVKTFPRRRAMSADDLDCLVLFLLLEVSAPITGRVFTID